MMRRSRRRGTRRNAQEQGAAVPTNAAVGDIHSDKKNIVILFVLYLLQGIPLGLSSAIPMYLQKTGVSYREQAGFSFALWPFSLKLLWAPIIDSVFISKFGRRKSWLIPSQYLIGIFMLFLSRNVNRWLGICEGCDNPDIGTLTGYFFVLNFLAATQDIAVDGWALTMLRRSNVGYAAGCNSVGQTAGYFLGYIVFMSLESADYITLSGFLFFWGIIFIIMTSFIAVLKREQDAAPLNRQVGIKGTYALLWKIVKRPAVRTTIIILLTSKIGYSACDAVATLKMIDIGMPKETLARLSLPMVPLQIILPLIVSKYLVRHRPLKLYLQAVPYRLCITVWIAMLVWLAPSHIQDGELDTYFAIVVFLAYIFIQITVNIMFVSVMSFFAQISDPAVGGTYMTLLNAVNNLGGTWPSTLALWMVDSLTFQICWEKNQRYICRSPECAQNAELTVNIMFVSVMSFFAQISDPAIGGTYMTLLNTVNNLGGTWPSTLALWMVDSLTFQICWEKNQRYICRSPECAQNAEGTILVDGFYVESTICLILGVCWLQWARKKIQDLQNRRQRDWKVVRGQR